MKVTREIARNALAYLEQYGTPEHAAYQCSVSLRAIEPYTDSFTAQTRDVLRKLTPERPDRLLAIQLLAKGEPVEAYTVDGGNIRFRAKPMPCGQSYDVHTAGECDCDEHQSI